MSSKEIIKDAFSIGDYEDVFCAFKSLSGNILVIYPMINKSIISYDLLNIKNLLVQKIFFCDILLLI